MINQGFETYGDTIQAATTKEAYQRANSMMDEAVQQYGMANPVGGLSPWIYYSISYVFLKKANVRFVGESVVLM